MDKIYTVEQQDKVSRLIESIRFHANRVTLLRNDIVKDRNMLQEKCDDLMNYVDSVEKEINNG